VDDHALRRLAAAVLDALARVAIGQR